MIKPADHIGPLEVNGISEIEWSLETSRSGRPVLKIGGRYVHSCYDPLREAQTIAAQGLDAIANEQANLLILLGPGLGYLPEAFSDKLDIPILLWDPFPQISRQLPDGQGPWQSKVTLVENSSEFEAELKRLKGKEIIPHILIHPGYEEFVRFEARYIIWCLRKYLQLTQPLSEAEAVISKRSLDALERIPFLSAIDELDGCLDGQTAILISPGPSSKMVLPYLTQCKNKGVVFAAVQSLRSLSEERVHVDFAVAPDPQDTYLSIYLEGFRPEFTALLADTSIDPDLLDLWDTKTFLFHLRTRHLHQIFWENCSLPVLDEPFISVSETMLVLAHSLGARQFVLVGMDFCSNAEGYKVRFKSQNLSGRSCWTNSHYFHSVRYLNYICPYLNDLGCRIWRVSDGLNDGLKIKGTELIAPSQIKTIINAEIEFSLPQPKENIAVERYFEAKGLLERLILQVEGEQRDSSSSAVDTSQFKDFQKIGYNQRRHCCESALEKIEDRRLKVSLNPPK